MSIYKPIVKISDKLSPELSDVKIGQKVSAIVNYKVIEKTKSYVVLSVNGFYITDNRRVF